MSIKTLAALLILGAFAAPLAAQSTISPGQALEDTLLAGDARMNGEGTPLYHPWVIQGRPGQRVRVWMRSFWFQPRVHWGRYQGGRWTELHPDSSVQTDMHSERILTLDSEGRYELRVSMEGHNGQGAYRLGLSDMALAAGVPIAPGQRIEGELAAGDLQGGWGSEDHYVITLAPGQVVTFCAEGDGFVPDLSLGTWRDERYAQIVAAESDWRGTWVVSRMSEGGEYRLVVNSTLGDAGEYVVRAFDGMPSQGPERPLCTDTPDPVPGAVHPSDASVVPLPPGELVHGRVDPGSPTDAAGVWYREFTYTGRAGEQLYLSAGSGDLNVSVSIGTGRGAEFRSLLDVPGTEGEAFGEYIVPHDGEYTVRVTAPGAQGAGAFFVRAKP